MNKCCISSYWWTPVSSFLHCKYQLESKRLVLLDYKASSDKDLLAALLFNNPQLGPKQVLQLFGLKKVLETINPGELRHLFTHCSSRAWYRLMADAKRVKLPKEYEQFKIIREHLMKWKPLFLFKTVENI